MRVQMNIHEAQDLKVVTKIFKDFYIMRFEFEDAQFDFMISDNCFEPRTKEECLKIFGEKLTKALSNLIEGKENE